MKILMLFSAFFLVLSALGFAVGNTEILSISAPSPDVTVEANSEVIIQPVVRNSGDATELINIECGIYADKNVNAILGIPTTFSVVIMSQETACTKGNEQFSRAYEIRVDAGQSGGVPIRVFAPSRDSFINLDTNSDGVTDRELSNWDSSHTIVCGLFKACFNDPSVSSESKGYVNDAGVRGEGRVWMRQNIQVTQSLLGLPSPTSVIIGTPRTQPTPVPIITPPIDAAQIRLLGFDFKVEGKKIIGSVKMKNEGASMSKQWVLEMQVRPQGKDPLAVFQSEQQICDPAHPENVFKSFQIGANEYAEVSLVTQDLPDGVYSVYFMSRDKCYNEAPVGNSKVAPFPFSSGRQDVTIGTPPKGFDFTLLIIGIIVLVGGFLVVKSMR